MSQNLICHTERYKKPDTVWTESGFSGLWQWKKLSCHFLNTGTQTAFDAGCFIFVN